MRSYMLFAAAAFMCVAVNAARDPTECEVCIKVLNDLNGQLSAEEKKDILKIEDKIGKFCAKPPSDKETKLCYYLDPIKRELSNPIKNGVPIDKICDRLRKKSAEICALRYTSNAPPPVEEITDFNKLRVKDLKNLMAEKGISCPECLEKSDFVRKLEQVLGKPAAQAAKEL